MHGFAGGLEVIAIWFSLFRKLGTLYLIYADVFYYISQSCVLMIVLLLSFFLLVMGSCSCYHYAVSGFLVVWAGRLREESFMCGYCKAWVIMTCLSLKKRTLGTARRKKARGAHCFTYKGVRRRPFQKLWRAHAFLGLKMEGEVNEASTLWILSRICVKFIKLSTITCVLAYENIIRAWILHQISLKID